MKSYGMILFYLFTWRTAIIVAMSLGLLLLVVALVSLALNFYFAAFALAVVAFLPLVGVPYLSAAPAMRKLISNRCLSMMPNFALRVGIVLLVLTITTAGFLPFIGWLFGMPGMTFAFALKLFIITSLYTGLTQLVLTSRYAFVGFNLAPFLILFLLNRFDETLWRLYNNDSVIVIMATIAIALWLFALWILAHKRTFKPAFASSSGESSLTRWMYDSRLLQRFELGTEASPAGSLLLSYPATISMRIIHTAYMLIASPLRFAGTWILFSPKRAANGPELLALFLLSSLFTGCIYSWTYGEIGARARLIWLRIGGSRNLVWRQLEMQLWINIALLSCLALGIGLISSLLGETGLLHHPILIKIGLLHYPLLIIACAFYDGYYNLCARVYGLSSLSQALVMLPSLGLVIATVIATIKNPELNLLFVIESGMALLAVMFRALSKFRFSQVDWQMLRPAMNKQAQAAS